MDQAAIQRTQHMMGKKMFQLIRDSIVFWYFKGHHRIVYFVPRLFINFRLSYIKSKLFSFRIATAFFWKWKLLINLYASIFNRVTLISYYFYINSALCITITGGPTQKNLYVHYIQKGRSNLSRKEIGDLSHTIL